MNEKATLLNALDQLETELRGAEKTVKAEYFLGLASSIQSDADDANLRNTLNQLLGKETNIESAHFSCAELDLLELCQMRAQDCLAKL